jgi:hypothetical protein
MWFLWLVMSAAVLAQAPASARIWIGHEAQIEEQLRHAEVTRLEDIGTGVTRPRRAHLKPAQPVESLVWKPLAPGTRGGFWESYKSEIAAYELDKFLGMHVVPPAVEREIDRERGAAIMWLEGLQSVKQKGGKVPSGPQWGKAVRRMLMFDNLIGNPDRNAGNILIGSPGEFILIDHSRAFVARTNINKIERVDAELWDRMLALNRADLGRVLGAWLDDGAIDALVTRRDRMAATVDKLVKKKGRGQVIIP